MGKVAYSDGSTPSICIIGAGFAGLTAAIRLKKDLGLTTFTIFDKNKDLGGVWFVNSYPGCAVDAPVHLYSWSFEQNPDWSLSNAPQAEILEYIKRTATKYDLYQHLKLNHTVQSMRWFEDARQWGVAVSNPDSLYCELLFFDFVITATGALSKPKIPSEFAAFQGPTMHSSKWDCSVTLENKVVAVIGSGSSAVQIIPALANKAKHLHCYQRNSTWVFPCPKKEYSRFTKWAFKHVPLVMRFYRWYQFWDHEQFHKVITADSKESKSARRIGGLIIDGQTAGYPQIQKKLTPSYAVGCSMVSKSSVYYETMTKPNVTLRTERITEISENSIVTEDGTRVNPDVLILATGFEYQNFLGGLPVIGTESTDINAEWQNKRPQNYYGVCTDQAPNNFILLGPYGTLGHNSSLFIMECQANFVIDLLRKVMKANYHRVSVKLTAQNENMEKLDKLIEKTVWGHEVCSSFYRNANGVHTAFYAGTGVSYWKRTRSANLNHFDLS